MSDIPEIIFPHITIHPGEKIKVISRHKDGSKRGYGEGDERLEENS